MEEDSPCGISRNQEIRWLSLRATITYSEDAAVSVQAAGVVFV